MTSTVIQSYQQTKQFSSADDSPSNCISDSLKRPGVPTAAFVLEILFCVSSSVCASEHMLSVCVCVCVYVCYIRKSLCNTDICWEQSGCWWWAVALLLLLPCVCLSVCLLMPVCLFTSVNYSHAQSLQHTHHLCNHLWDLCSVLLHKWEKILYDSTNKYSRVEMTDSPIDKVS